MLRLTFLAQVVTLMLGIEWNEVEVPMEEEESVEDTEQGKLAMNLLLAVRQKAGLPMPPAWFSPAMLWQRITSDWFVNRLLFMQLSKSNFHSLPFLRCCAIFFKCLTGVPEPFALTQPQGDTFKELCRFLCLPDNCTQLMASDFHMKIATKYETVIKAFLF